MSVITRFGFLFGCMKVTRTAENKGVAIISVSTPKVKLILGQPKQALLAFMMSKVMNVSWSIKMGM